MVPRRYEGGITLRPNRRRGEGVEEDHAMYVLSFILAALVVAGCTQGTTSPSGTVGPSASVETSLPAASSGERRIPIVAGAPVPLEAGLYLTPHGFAPVMSIALPTGWYGAGSAREFGVGQGLDEINQRFADAGMYVSPIDMAYDEAVAAFRELEGLTSDQEPTTQSLGGRDSTIFYVHAENGPIVLDPIAPGADINEGTAHVIFVDANGTTMMIRTEVFDDAGVAPLDDVIASIEFP